MLSRTSAGLEIDRSGPISAQSGNERTILDYDIGLLVDDDVGVDDL